MKNKNVLIYIAIAAAAIAGIVYVALKSSSVNEKILIYIGIIAVALVAGWVLGRYANGRNKPDM